MPEAESPLASLHRAAEAVRQQLRLNAYDAAAVERLAAFIEEQRATIKPGEREGVITALGCFLGQCLVHTYQGEWAAGLDNTTGVGIGGKSFFNPFYRVSQQLAHGLPESVAVFFAQVPTHLQAAQRRKNWI